MQALITVGLRDRDEVAEFRVKRLEQRMHGAERVIALHHFLHNDAETKHIHHLVEAFVLLLHLAVNAPRRLDPADHADRQAFLRQFLGKLRFDGGERFAPHDRLRSNALGNHAVAHRIQGAKPQVLQFRLDPFMPSRCAIGA